MPVESARIAYLESKLGRRDELLKKHAYEIGYDEGAESELASLSLLYQDFGADALIARIREWNE